MLYRLCCVYSASRSFTVLFIFYLQFFSFIFQYNYFVMFISIVIKLAISHFTLQKMLTDMIDFVQVNKDDACLSQHTDSFFIVRHRIVFSLYIIEYRICCCSRVCAIY